jgi:ech hydrogenase subunit D
MIANINEISIDRLLGETQKLAGQGYRFVTTSCTDLGDGKLDVLYHFDKDAELQNLRIKADRGDEVPSISKIYLCAVLIENEMSELFGLKVAGMAIDYGGHMLLAPEALKTPQAKITIEQRGAK